MKFLIANWHWATPAGFAILGLVFLAYIARSWRAALAAVVILGCVVTSGYFFKQGYDKAWEEVTRKREQTLKDRLATLEEALAQYTKQKEIDDAELARLQRLIDETPKNKHRGIPAGVTRRIGRIR